MSRLEAVSDRVFRFRDTCNAYLMTAGARGLLVDFGAGDVLDHLGEAGVERVSDLLITHHHRDQLQGVKRAVDAGVRVWVPLVEEALIGGVDDHWQAREVVNSYNPRQDRFSLLGSVPVTGTLADYATFGFEDLELHVLPTPGHTVGSISIAVDIGGRRIVFSGDILAGPGKVWSLAATQWTYNGGEGIPATIASLLDLRERRVDLLLPSHGEAMDDPAAAIDLTVERLRRLLELRQENPHLLELRARPYEAITPHLLRNRTSVANSYVLLSGTGAALFFDFGYDFMTGAAAGSDRASRRPSVYTLAALKRDFGVGRVEAVVPTHYHDDHVAGCNLLRNVEGTEVWAAESFVDVLEQPHRYDLPCLWYDPIPVDRSLPVGNPIRWHEHRFELYQQPGHTLYAVAIALQVDGKRVVIVGDQLDGAGSELNYVYANGFRIDDYRESAELYRELEPDLLLFGHRDPLEPQPGYLEQLWQRGADLAQLHRELLPLEEVDLEGSGPLVRIRPYRSRIRPGTRLTLEVDVRNPHPRAELAEVELVLPAGWSVSPAERRFELLAGQSALVQFDIEPSGPPVRRARLAADLTVGSRRFGQVAEALVTVR